MPIAHTLPSTTNASATSEGLRIERDGPVLTFTFADASGGNEISGGMFDSMLACLREEAQAPRARVLRVRAEGDRFCVGRERAAQTPEAMRIEVARLIDFKRALRNSPLIAIAEVQGDALGFGFGLTICCDFAIAAEGARLGFPEMLFGLPPMAIMAYLGEYALPRHVFPMLLLGEPISAQRALQIGLLNNVVSAAKLAVCVDDLIAKVLKLDANAVRNCKEFFRLTRDGSFESNARLALDGLVTASLALRARRDDP